MADKQKPSNKDVARAYSVAAAAWFVPGLGHMLLRKWGRGVVCFLTVASFAVAGLFMRGNVFPASLGDAFDFLGFLADFSTGAFYFLSKLVANGGPDVSRAAGDYGTRFFATAGVLNLLFVLDAHELARGRKT